ncbi:glutamate--cysteine ligase [Terrabacter aerolatus]|uniref:Putative glutamate--cysteine ligase 2 n=2 Tax=Terrabacter aerolatus TaxID=422442 RepID=A0A512CVF9_9MICO|nr:glutamate--cysteine ligase [Terrabacter aerolatus]GEO28214.1 putative glutamate--cysteine ligase 2 [Terrabacter aerolatus]
MRTLGVEEEMLLVDARSGRPLPLAEQVLGRAAERACERGSRSHEGSAASAAPAAKAAQAGLVDAAGGCAHGALESEFQQQQIETHTAPAADLGALRSELSWWRGEAAASAVDCGAGLAALATSPLTAHPTVSRSPRYLWLEDRYGLTAREHLVCGCHVHVSVESDEEGVAVLDRIRVWLPVLLALSANSPFWDGQDTGFASYRAQVLARLPSWGPNDRFGSAAAYHRLVRDLVRSTVILDEGMAYFDARLARRYPTVEVRAADVCSTVEEAVVLAALCRALVETAGREWAAGLPAPEVSTRLLRLATWQAGHDGLEGHLLDWRTGRPRPCWSVLDTLLEHVGPALEAAGDLAAVRQGLDGVREEGNGAVRQRAVLARSGRLADVVADSVRTTAACRHG